MKENNEDYEVGSLMIEVLAKPKKNDPLTGKEIGVLLWGKETKTKGAKKGSPEEYSRPLIKFIPFMHSEDLKLFQLGIETMQEALERNEGEK